MRPISAFARRAADGAIATGSRPRSRAACATERLRRAMPSSRTMRTNASWMFSPVVMAPWLGRMTTGSLAQRVGDGHHALLFGGDAFVVVLDHPDIVGEQAALLIVDLGHDAQRAQRDDRGRVRVRDGDGARVLAVDDAVQAYGVVDVSVSVQHPAREV